MKPSQAQINFFQKLTEEKEFPTPEDFIPKQKNETYLDSLRARFSDLNQKSASAWIEAAMALPKIDESGEKVVPAPFAA